VIPGEGRIEVVLRGRSSDSTEGSSGSKGKGRSDSRGMVEEDLREGKCF
jgi:hypothetical protein